MTSVETALAKPETKAQYVGDCVSGFDLDGDCTIPTLPYKDVSAFAVAEEAAKEISKEEFNQHVELGTLVPRKDTLYLFDSDNGVFMMYDHKKDRHYFFS